MFCFFATRQQRLTWVSLAQASGFYMGTHCSLTETHKQAKTLPGLLWSATGNLKAIRNPTFYLSWARTSLKSLNLCSFLGVWTLYILISSSQQQLSQSHGFQVPNFHKDKSNCLNSYFYKDFQSHCEAAFFFFLLYIKRAMSYVFSMYINYISSSLVIFMTFLYSRCPLPLAHPLGRMPSTSFSYLNLLGFIALVKMPWI